MILRIIDEIEKALNHDLYFAALNLALTLPDICGKAEHPDLRTGERYKKWYDEIVGVTEKPPKCTEDEPEMLYLSVEWYIASAAHCSTKGIRTCKRMGSIPSQSTIFRW